MATKRPAEGEATEGGPAKVTKTSKEGFIAVFQKLRAFLVEREVTDGHPKHATEYLDKMLEYNVPKGKLNRGLTVVDGLKAIKGELSDDETFKAATLGWCIEFLQAFFLVADDIMDNSVTRRGQPCWYKVPEVGLRACNDAIILENDIYILLKEYFGTKPYYTQLLELFLQVTNKTAMGQMLDLLTESRDNMTTKYTEEAYFRIVRYKTAFYSFYLPVACAMILGGYTDPKLFSLAESVCCKMGEYFQVQDDYLDCYGSPEVIGKIGTDIQDSKCSWLCVQALQKCNESQRATLLECYGLPEEENVQRVKELYKELELEALYRAYEEESYKKLDAEIQGITELPKALFTGLLAKIYKRSK